MTTFLDQAGAELVAAAQRLGPDGLATGTAGNLSVRVAPDRILVTPSAVAYQALVPGHLCLVSDAGEVIDAGPHPPSTELPIGLPPIDRTRNLCCLTGHEFLFKFHRGNVAE